MALSGERKSRQRERERPGQMPISSSQNNYTPDQGTCQLSLWPQHLAQLKASGISLEVVKARGYRSIKAHEAHKFGFTRGQARDGLLIPIFPPEESQPALYRLRPDNPRTRKDGKVIKYEQPKGARLRIDVPPLLQEALRDRNRPLIITEGEKKGDALCTAILRENKQLAVVDLPGVWGFVSRTSFGDITFSNDLRLIPLQNREVFIVYDSDVMAKPQVRRALQSLTDLLGRKGARVYWIELPARPGEKKGVDDYLVQGHSLDDLLALAKGPEAERNPVPPVIELLEKEPGVMKTFGYVHEGRAYIATYLPVRLKFLEKAVNGKVVTLQKPETRDTKELFVIRDDGLLFGPGTLHDLDELPFKVQLPRDLPPLGLLDREGIRLLGKHDPKETFAEIKGLIGSFMDFARSLGPQEAVEELVVAWIFATYLTPGLSTASYIWIYGVPGAGKSKLLEIIAALSFQARILSAHSTTAAVRDIASLGGTVCWDEAEALAGVKTHVDPEKRGILLAGLRRQTAWATLREPVGKRGWQTINIPVFCPKVFTATQVPPEPLLSRCIVIPLVRSSDREKTQKQPRGRTWDSEAAKLRRALWDWALHSLAKAGDVEDWVTENESELLGRALDPWIAPLVAAKLLEDAGVDGLYERIRELALAYQEEELVSPDLTTYVVAAIAVLYHESGITDINGINGIKLFGASEVAKKAQQLLEANDQDPDWVSSHKVGRRLAKLRLYKTKTTRGQRKWVIGRSVLENLLATYPQARRLFQDFVELNGLNVRNATFADQNNVFNANAKKSPPLFYSHDINATNATNATFTDKKRVSESPLMPPAQNHNVRNATSGDQKGVSVCRGVVCPNCRAELPPGNWLKCPECGTELKKVSSTSRISRCISCGRKRELNKLSLCDECQAKTLSSPPMKQEGGEDCMRKEG